MAPASTLGSKSSRGLVARTVLASLAGLAALVSVTTVTSDANAFSVKKTTKGDMVHWETETVPFTIDPSVDQNVATGSDATKEAMASWSGTVGAPEIAGNPPTADSPTAPTFDRKNGVFFMPNGYDPAGKALAITVLTYDNASGKILDADVIFNGIYSFAVLPPDARGDDSDASNTTDSVDQGGADQGDFGQVYDLHHVVAHELGHSLGMNDEMQNQSALMYKYTSPDDAALRGPASDDVTGLAELYAKNASATGSGCGSATISPKDPSKTASNAAMFATMGLLLFLVLRARSDRRARLAFVLASAAACVAFVPSLTGKGVAKAAVSPAALNLGHARAKVLASSVAIENGLFRTTYDLTTTTCRTDLCPKTAHGITYGGTVGNITQEVGGYYAPDLGDEVDVSFKNLPSRFAPLANPLAGRISSDSTVGEVKIVTRAAAIAN